jgi:hypothetical protein
MTKSSTKVFSMTIMGLSGRVYQKWKGKQKQKKDEAAFSWGE